MLYASATSMTTVIGSLPFFFPLLSLVIVVYFIYHFLLLFALLDFAFRIIDEKKNALFLRRKQFHSFIAVLRVRHATLIRFVHPSPYFAFDVEFVVEEEGTVVRSDYKSSHLARTFIYI